MKKNPHKADEEREDSTDPAAMETASQNLIQPPEPPEISPATQDLTEWDQPPDATGTAAPKLPPSDESTVAEELVEEGVEEADRDQRIAAVDPDAEQ